MSIGVEAFFWGIASAISLPLGAILGILWKPKQKINSSFMAFGAGALLFALTIELFAHVPHHVEEHGMMALLFPILGAVCGGLLFDSLNHILNNRGAYLRKLSSAKDYVIRLRAKRAKKLLEQMSKVKVLHSLPPEMLVSLVSRVRPVRFKSGEVIFKQDEKSDCMYFILSGNIEIIRHETSNDKSIATLGANETFGELGVVSEMGRSAEAKAKNDVTLYKIMKADFDDLMSKSPELKASIQKLAKERISDLDQKLDGHVDPIWKDSCISHLDNMSTNVSVEEIRKETAGHAAAGGAALAIWLGIMIDGIPESLVIGMLNNSAAGMSVAFIAGVFLANLPEAMSSSVSMEQSGMKVKKILMLWMSIVVVTGVGAYIGASVFPANPTGGTYYLVLGIEGLAAGAMLTMIAETMLPEAFEQGGAIVGLSTLFGFLTALAVKVSY